MKHAHSLHTITPEELRARLDAAENLFLIDTLPADHFYKVHLPGARNACVFEMTFIDQVHALCSDSSCPIVVYGIGNNSLDSRTAAEKLSMAGYSNVTLLEGGLERWKQSGLPLHGTAPNTLEETDRLLADGEYTVITDESIIGWTGRNSNTSHYGTVGLANGHLHVEDGTIQGSFTVDMESIENINLAGSDLQKVLISHLKSEDFFLTDGFPAARFNIRGGRFAREAEPTRPNCELSGTLDLRGIQNDLSFKATLVKWLDGRLHLTAHFDLDRTLWGITYGSSSYYQHLGMHTVFDGISIEMKIVAELTE
ncbi:YceI family protein [Desulfopila aestuarii]|uniref:Rhodanese-related sulfurtransferase n=1 Tax=Desulfopila aestuarii DSM 18488 TaxID=1121416 RepID=A0A1M7YGF7_9BACT|nr:YceI family protein [Desulfopila aestuarii]SHO51727.1 Rhodanese-related sulfurtransferase [Desulfopila aestuarii DSM 18488]